MTIMRRRNTRPLDRGEGTMSPWAALGVGSCELEDLFSTLEGDDVTDVHTALYVAAGVKFEQLGA